MKTRISIRTVGQFGNQLFDYCFAKVLAARTGLAYVPPSCFYDKRRRRLNWTGPPLFAMQPSPQVGTPGSKHYTTCAGHWVDFTRFDDAGFITFTTGYYQRYEFYKPYKELIRNEWLKLLAEPVPTDDNAVYIHARRTDYVSPPGASLNPYAQATATTLDEYAACLRHFPDARRLVITTDNPDDPFLNEFHLLGLPFEITRGTWDSDLRLLLSCRNLLMSQSTYSWWAGFLGQAERIVCPLFPNTLWYLGKDITGHPVQHDLPNLIVDDEPDRWVWVTE